MIKTTLVVLNILGVISVWAQSPPPGTISRASGDTNQFGTGSAMFTNRFGATYSAEQLATQLQTLRSAVEQTLPQLTAYTESVSNSASTGNRSVVGTISEVL